MTTALVLAVAVVLAGPPTAWPSLNCGKQKAVKAALRHPNGPKCSDHELAEHCGVDHKTVLKYRQELELTREIPQSDIRTGRDGRTTNTANIGKPKPPEHHPVAADEYGSVVELLPQRPDCAADDPRTMAWLLAHMFAARIDRRGYQLSRPGCDPARADQLRAANWRDAVALAKALALLREMDAERPRLYVKR